MGRLIDADELIVMEYGGIKFVPKEFIDDAPTVDAIEVIRCGKCEHWDTADIHSTVHPNCRCKAIVGKLYTDESFYCCYAERRQDD